MFYPSAGNIEMNEVRVKEGPWAVLQVEWELSE